jgi:hypothetical protein
MRCAHKYRTLFADKTQLYIQAIAKTEIITAGYQNRPKPNKAGRLITIMTTEKKTMTFYSYSK